MGILKVCLIKGSGLPVGYVEVGSVENNEITFSVLDEDKEILYSALITALTTELYPLDLSEQRMLPAQDSRYYLQSGSQVKFEDFVRARRSQEWSEVDEKKLEDEWKEALNELGKYNKRYFAKFKYGYINGIVGVLFNDSDEDKAERVFRTLADSIIHDWMQLRSMLEKVEVWNVHNEEDDIRGINSCLEEIIKSQWY